MLTNQFLLLGCPAVLAKVNELKSLVDSACADDPTLPALPCSCQSTWTSIPATSIGTSDLQHASTMTFTIPDLIPHYANEVLIHAGVFSGRSNRGPYHDLKIFTQIGTTRYEKYLMVYSWSQEAYNTNSDNMWFPMPPNHRVYLTVPAAHGINGGVRLFAIGYR